MYLKSNSKKIYLLTIILICSSLSFSFAYNPVKPISYKGYKNQGPFVENPANAGNYTGYLISMVPATVITEPIRLVYNPNNISDKIGYNILYASTKSFGFLFGAFPYILKETFYDTPAKIIKDSNKGKSESINQSLSDQKTKPKYMKYAKQLGLKKQSSQEKSSRRSSKQTPIKEESTDKSKSPPSKKKKDPAEEKDNINGYMAKEEEIEKNKMEESKKSVKKHKKVTTKNKEKSTDTSSPAWLKKELSNE